MSDHIKTMNAPGIPCPECQTPIVVEATKLLSGAGITCAACGLELRVDREKSASTINVLSEYMQTLNEMKPDSAMGSSPSTASNRKPTRRQRQPRQSRQRTARA